MLLLLIINVQRYTVRWMTFNFVFKEYLSLSGGWRPRLNRSDLCHLLLVVFEVLVDVADPPLGDDPHHPASEAVLVPPPGPLLLPVQREDEDGGGQHGADTQHDHHGHSGSAGAWGTSWLLLLLRPERLEPGVEVGFGVAGEICHGQLADHVHGLA